MLDVSWGKDAQQTRNKAAAQNLAEPGAHGATAATEESQPEKHP
ncbi:MAG: hypothetical protein VB142_06490 [Burkholderia sp.]